jgi:hypothetical protein
MREILFRGMTEQGEWIYGSYHSPFKGMAQIIHKQHGNLSHFTEVNADTVGQYTGYKMKGVQVFFGDLVSNNYKTDKEVIREIVLYKGQMMMKLVKGKSRLGKYILLDDMCNLNYEIIGNIWEDGE